MQRLLKSAYCFFAALLLTTAAAAQHKISGRVIDTTQEPLVGATITLKEKPSVGTTTDTEGRYTLTLPDQKEYTVQVSFVGYVTATKKTTAARQGRLDFILKEDQMNLSTVVITGTRTPKRVLRFRFHGSSEALVMILITPPMALEPYSVEAAPFTISTRSTLSRLRRL